MASTIDTLKKASSAPLYDWLDFSDFHPLKQGRIRYRVNLSKKMKDEIAALQAENDAIKVILENKNATETELAEARARETASNDAYLAFTASLVMADDEKGADTLTLGEWKTFIESAQDDDDSKFTLWVQSEVLDRVQEYQQKSFLSRARSGTK